MADEIVLLNDGLVFSGESTLSIMIMDKSGSMKKFGKAPLKAINDHIKSLKAANDGRKHYCGIISFNDKAQVEKEVMDVSRMVPLFSYHPGNGTLLWETVDKTLRDLITLWLPYQSEKLKIVVGVISDGEDNHSDRHLYPKSLQTAARWAINHGWELLTFGIGINGRRLAAEMGFPMDSQHAFTMEANEQGLKDTSVTMTQTTLGGWQVKDNHSASDSPSNP
ncbi:MAG: VWA domain-containing protein [Candidatus Parcubacteria bacterium]|nr:VWA domain-containing protein [Candidatus Parcubacteria bacterium]